RIAECVRLDTSASDRGCHRIHVDGIAGDLRARPTGVTARVAGGEPPATHCCRSGPDLAFVRIDEAEVLDDLEPAGLRLRDVHVHAQVVLPGHHLGGTARTLF